jgi:hypothetical protein
VKILGVLLSATLLAPGMREDNLPSICEHPKNTVATVIMTKTGKKTSLKTVLELNGKSKEQETPGLEVDDTLTVQYRDTIVAVEDGRLKECKREFGDVKWEHSEHHAPPLFEEAQTITDKEKSGAEQGVVRFEWDPQAKRYTATFLDNQTAGDAEQLEALIPSVSALFLSPANSPSAAEPWSVPAVQLKDLILYPGGDLFVVPKANKNERAHELARLRTAYWDGFSADIQARVVPNPKDTDADLATIELKGTVLVQCEARRGSGEDTQPLRKIKETAALTGEAIWNVKQNHLDRLMIDWTGEITNSEPATINGDPKTVGNSTMVLSDVCHWEMNCEYAIASKPK